MASTQLHPDDIVMRRDDQTTLAVIERTHTDIDTHLPSPARAEDQPIKRGSGVQPAAFRRFMRDGIPPKETVLIRYQNELSLELVKAASVELVDRSLLIGDIVKRSAHDAQSGVVLNTFTHCTLQPMCDVTYLDRYTFKGLPPAAVWEPTATPFCAYPSGRPPPLVDIPASELQYADALSEDDLVIYKDWVGRVEGLTNNIHVRLSDSCVVEITDEIGEHVDGETGGFSIGDIVKTKKGQLRNGNWIYGSYNPNTPPVGTVVSIRTSSIEVAWIQRRIGSLQEDPPHYELESPELESQDFFVYQRFRRPGLSRGRLETISNSEIDVRLNLRVRFQDLAGACLKYSTPEAPNKIPRLERQANLGYDLNVFDVLSFRTDVAVEWQDGSITTERSIDIVPDGNIDDEHAAWPAEIVHTLKLHPVPNMENVLQPERVGVVQVIHAAERMATVRWLPDSYIWYAKDPDWDGDGDGVIPSVLSHFISPAQGTDEEISLYDIEAPAALNVRRGDIALITRSTNNEVVISPTDVTWLGEIVDTRPDSTIVIRLGAALNVRDVILQREQCIVAVRSDGTDQPDAWNDDDMEDEIDDSDDEHDAFSSDWDNEGEESELEEAIARYEDEFGVEMDEDEVKDENWESADEDNDDIDVEMYDAQEHQTPLTSQSNTPVEGDSNKDPALPNDTEHGMSGLKAPPSYSILEGEVPADHRFRNQPATATSQHVKRTQKEHKILRDGSTLPNGVYVRSYESRMDLLRVLIVGPTETPYANAPFVIDFYLPPNFPSGPPEALFHSWPAHANIGGIGRVNPNLYEDGKICLSILGTWVANKSESWTSARSTLLQVIVSLLGLVLVREPYFNEAGYEALVGTEESRRPSALYSERVFIRAKGFLITALADLHSTPGLKGLEDIIEWLYRDSTGPRLLASTIKTVEEVLASSDDGREPDGLTTMSKGACIPLRRVLDRLRGLVG